MIAPRDTREIRSSVRSVTIIEYKRHLLDGHARFPKGLVLPFCKLNEFCPRCSAMNKSRRIALPRTYRAPSHLRIARGKRGLQIELSQLLSEIRRRANCLANGMYSHTGKLILRKAAVCSTKEFKRHNKLNFTQFLRCDRSDA